jgi:hypothetical protein
MGVNACAYSSAQRKGSCQNSGFYDQGRGRAAESGCCRSFCRSYWASGRSTERRGDCECKSSGNSILRVHRSGEILSFGLQELHEIW